MTWMILYLNAIELAAKITICTASRQEQIESIDFHPDCRDCNLPEGMDW
jgi:hypothetical protein